MRTRSVILVLLTLSIAVAANAQDKTHLAEIFANINCQNCRVPDDAFNNFVAAHPDIQVLNIHNSNTDQNDPFYVGANPSADTRDKFYGGGVGLTDPVAFIDGYFSGSGKDQETSWERNYQLQLTSPLAPLSVTKTVADDGRITLSVTASAKNPSKLYVALKESKVVFHNTEAYGTMPNDLWNDVFRVMLPAATGSASFVGPKTITIPPYDPMVNPDWNVDNMEAIVFVQEVQESDATHSHPIEAMAIVPLGGSAAVASNATGLADRLHFISNPSASITHFSVELSKSSDVRVVMMDMLGRKVQTIANRNLPQGSTSINLEGERITAGCYLMQLFVDGRAADQQKLIVE